MNIGNLPSLKIMHPTWAKILWHKVVTFYDVCIVGGANLPPPPTHTHTIQTSTTLQSFTFISFQQMTFNLGNFNFKASFLVKFTEFCWLVTVKVEKTMEGHLSPQLHLEPLGPHARPLARHLNVICLFCWGVCCSKKELFPVLSV